MTEDLKSKKTEYKSDSGPMTLETFSMRDFFIESMKRKGLYEEGVTTDDDITRYIDENFLSKKQSETL